MTGTRHRITWGSVAGFFVAGFSLRGYKSKEMNLSAAKFKARTIAADVLGFLLPESVLASLSGLGDAPQFGNSLDLARIQNAIRTSERGEPYLLFALFRDMIQNDPHLQAEIGKRIMSFMGQEETIEPVDKKNQDDVAAAQVIKDMRDNCDNWREGSVHLAQGHIWPISGAEKIYAPVNGEDKHKFKFPVQYRLKKLHPIPYPLYTYKVSYWNVNTGTGTTPGSGPALGSASGTGSIPINSVSNDERTNPSLIWNPNDWHADLRFYSTQGNGLIDWSPGRWYKPDPNRHVLHSSSVSTTSMRDNFGGLLRSLLPFWLYSKSGVDWFARAMERYGSPFAIAYANTSNKNIFDLLTKAFNTATKNNALIVPPQAKIELKEIMVSGMADGYAKFIEICNTEKTKAILGQTLSTSSKGSGMMGGSGVADLHGEVRAEWAQFDKRSYGEMQCKQIFEPYLKINGYKGKVKVVRGGLSPANMAVMASTLQKFALAGIFVDEESEQDLTSMVGLKMKIKDLQAEALKAKDKNDKSKSDRSKGSED